MPEKLKLLEALAPYLMTVTAAVFGWASRRLRKALKDHEEARRAEYEAVVAPLKSSIEINTKAQNALSAKVEDFIRVYMTGAKSLQDKQRDLIEALDRLSANALETDQIQAALVRIVMQKFERSEVVELTEELVRVSKRRQGVK